MNGMQQPYMPMMQNQGMFGGFNFPSQFGGVSYPQFNMGFNPYGGMFSGFGGFNPYMQSYQMQQPMMPRQFGGGNSDMVNVQGNPMFTNQEFVSLLSNLVPGVGAVRGVGNFLGGLFGGTRTPSTTDDAYSSSDGGTMSSSQAASAAAAETMSPSF